MAKHTEKKHCDNCSKVTIWLKNEEDEAECLLCHLKISVSYWEDQIVASGFDQTKIEWESLRNSTSFSEIESELTPNSEEDKEWKKTKFEIDALFVPQRNKHTERKHCNKCNKEVSFLKATSTVSAECLPCSWNNFEKEWKEIIKSTNLEQAKKQWEQFRDGDFYKEVELELTPEEKNQWQQLVSELNQLFVPQKDNEKQEKPFDWAPYIIGGGVLIVTVIIGLVIYFTHGNKNKHN